MKRKIAVTDDKGAVASLFQAIRAGNLQKANALLAKDPAAAKGRENETHKTALIAAIETRKLTGGRLDFFQQLIDAGVDINDQPLLPNGALRASALIRALELGHYEIASLLIDRSASCKVVYAIPPKGTQQESRTAFYALWAGARIWCNLTFDRGFYQKQIDGFKASFNLLVCGGAEPNAIMGLPLGLYQGAFLFSQNTILNILCSGDSGYNNIDPRIIDLFMKHCDAQVSSEECPPALVVAAFHGNAPLVKRICDQYKKTVQGVRWKEKTPLDYCTMGLQKYNNKDILKQRYQTTREYLECLEKGDFSVFVYADE